MPNSKTSSFYSEISTAVAEETLNPLRRPSNASVWFWKAKEVERVAISSTPEAQNTLMGTFCLSIYISVWVLGTITIPVTVLLLSASFYVTGGFLAITTILCYAIPCPVSQGLLNFARLNFCRYFKETSLRLEHVPDPINDRPTVFCINPHGVFSMSWSLCYISQELSHAVFCFSSMLRLNPYLRVLTQLLGHPSDAKKETIIEHMRNGRSIALIPGAWHEATLHSSSIDRLYIKKRQGFIKYALEFGCTVTPTYCFGERKTYDNIQGCYRFRFWLNDWKVLATMPWGRWWCPVLPRPIKLHTVIGSPIQLPHIPCPTSEDVQMWHQIYIDEMVELYNRYKVQFYGPEGAKRNLEIW